MHPVAVARAWDETASLRAIRLESADVARSHVAPGQYLRLRADGREGAFALASAPGRPLELLVKRGSPVGDALAALAPGAAVEASEALGPGFPVDAARGRDLLLFAAGSGITPIRALLHHVAGNGRELYGRIMLFWGHRRADEFPYAEESRAWRASAIELIPVVSAPDEKWAGARGYVQDALLALDDRPPMEQASAFLSGMKPMVASVTDALVSLGLPRDRVHLNF